MNKWLLRLTGLLILSLLALLFMESWFNPDIPDYLDPDRKHSQTETVGKTPPAPKLGLTSLENSTLESTSGNQNTAANIGGQTVEGATLPQAPSLELTALDEDIPVLRNPDSRVAKSWLQAGSFSDRANAAKHAAKLKSNGWSVEVVPAKINGRTLYRVYVGPLIAADVPSYLDKLKAMGITDARETTRD